MYEHRPSIHSQQNMDSQILTPTKTYPVNVDSDFSPTISRYGRSHKPKMQDDYVSTDKKVSAYLKISPGNQMQYFNITKEPKKKLSPKKTSPESGIKRGRPPKPKTPLNDQQVSVENSVKPEPQDPSLPVDGCEWMVGDLAWGRVGGHPFWPCVIALDPIHKIFTKIVQRGRNHAVGQRWMHVQFFGDNGRRSWLNSSAIMNFNGRDTFMQLAETVLAGMRKKDPKQTSAFVIKPAVVQVWEKAVQEAEDLVNATREDRIAFFSAHFPPVIPKLFTREDLIDKVLIDIPSSPPKKRGRKRKAETPKDDTVKRKQIKLEEVEMKQEKAEVMQQPEVMEKEQKQEVKVKEEPREESLSLLSSTPRTIADRKKRQALLIQMARSNQMAAADAAAGDAPVAPDTPTPSKRPSFTESTPIDKKKPKKKYKKIVDIDFQNFCSRNFEKLSDEHPELNEKEINKHLQNMWNHMDDTAKSRYRARKGCATKEQEDSDSLEETLEEVEEENESSKSSNEAELQSSTSTSPPPSVGAVLKPVSAKRSCKTLFTGVKSEKVCQICEKAGETVRCRGPCQGFYHPVCITNPPPPTPSVLVKTPSSAKKGKRGRPKKSIGESPQIENESPLLEQTDIQGPIEAPERNREKESKIEVIAEIEVVEAEGKHLNKARKGSKDSLSAEEEEGFRCKDCSQGRTQPCFACHEYMQKKTGEAKLYRCITSNCGKVYHEECLKAWPQTSWRGTNRAVLTCPQHTCHTCVSDNPGVIKARYSNDKLVRCVRCPSSYHYGNYCLPAGSEILTNSQIICPQHYKPPKKSMIHHVNAAWCFICASGGSLICCDLCPTAFHADCLKISTPPDTYVCEDCQTGRFPLYGEIVWVKLGVYRWWPAEILYPAQIPDNILNLPHVRGEFAVRFFGSHDHYWVNRGRVFLYQDGDTAGKSNYKKSSVDQMFEKAVKEASEAQRRYLEEKASRDAETRPGMKPPNYVKLKTNKPVGNVRTMDMNLSNLTPCECDPKSDNPCAPDSDCLNRILMVECHPQVCPAGEKCCNQLFEKRQYPPLQPYQTQERGWGLKTLVPLKKGDFVIEYVGEMIDEEEYKRRLVEMHERNEDNFYFLTIDKDRMLDAGPKGNVARFMNHSCQPNCETQKWTVNGDTRVGLFALCDIPADTELVFNYNLESTGNDKKPCMCGAPNCSGFIGVKAIKEESKEKKPVKKKRVTKVREKKCFMCSKEGDLLRCDGKHCPKAYHLSCLGKKQAPQGYWLCPWHQCSVCNKGRVQRCTLCVNSYCQEHAEGNIREDPDSKHLICTSHDQDKDGKKVDLEDSKNSSVVMEVDGNSSDNSTTTSSLSSDPSTQEITNNNVMKKEETLRLRTRRSKSFASDTVVNENTEKINMRRKRPSSVDEALITNKDQLEPKNKKSLKIKEKNSTTVSIARDIIDEVINNLPDKSNLSMNKIEKCEENKEVTDNTSSTKKETDNNSLNLARADLCHENTERDQFVQVSNECNEKEVTKDRVCKSEEVKEKNVTANFSKHENSVITADIDLPLPSVVAEHNLLSDVEDFKPTTTIKKVLTSEHNETDKIELMDENSSTKESESDLDSLKLTNSLENGFSHSSFPESIGKENGVPNGLLTGEKVSPVPEIREESIDESGKKEKSEESSNPANIVADDNVDDFELSYSENSSDKLFKSVNNSESSIEMKLTNCGTTDDTISRKLEEIHGTKELVNGIEQSNVMEVA